MTVRMIDTKETKVNCARGNLSNDTFILTQLCNKIKYHVKITPRYIHQLSYNYHSRLGMLCMKCKIV